MEPVIVTFELREGDLFRASAWMLFKKWYIAAFYLLNGLTFIYLVWVLATHGFTLADLRGFVFPFVFFVVIPIGLYWSARSNVRSLQPQQRQHHFEFTNDAVHLNTGLSSAVVAWEAVQKVVETRTAFYLFLQKSICHVIPKRGARNQGDVVRLGAMLASRLGSRAKLCTRSAEH